MRSVFSYQVAIWLPMLAALLLSVAHGSGHYLLVGLVQGGLFLLAVRGIIRWEQHLDKTSLASWLFFAVFGVTLLLSCVFWVFGDLALWVAITSWLLGLSNVTGFYVLATTVAVAELARSLSRVTSQRKNREQGSFISRFLGWFSG